MRQGITSAGGQQAGRLTSRPQPPTAVFLLTGIPAPQPSTGQSLHQEHPFFAPTTPNDPQDPSRDTSSTSSQHCSTLVHAPTAPYKARSRCHRSRTESFPSAGLAGPPKCWRDRAELWKSGTLRLSSDLSKPMRVLGGSQLPKCSPVPLLEMGGRAGWVGGVRHTDARGWHCTTVATGTPRWREAQALAPNGCGRPPCRSLGAGPGLTLREAPPEAQRQPSL